MPVTTKADEFDHSYVVSSMMPTNARRHFEKQKRLNKNDYPAKRQGNRQPKQERDKKRIIQKYTILQFLKPVRSQNMV